MKILILISIFFCFLSLTHCGPKEKDPNAQPEKLPTRSSVDSVVVAESHCLDGPYKAEVDLLGSFFWFQDQDYDVNIASSNETILVQLKEVLSDEELSKKKPNITCSEFNRFNGTATLFAQTIQNHTSNDKDFTSGIKELSMKVIGVNKEGNITCEIESLVAATSDGTDDDDNVRFVTSTQHKLSSVSKKQTSKSKAKTQTSKKSYKSLKEECRASKKTKSS